MKRYLKYLLSLIIFSLSVSITGILINSVFPPMTDIPDLLILTAAFMVSSIVTLVIFLRGTGRKAEEQTMHTFIAITVKFIIELFIALLWFAAAKKTSLSYVVLFFILYLSFSIFSIGVILNVLKGKVL